MDRILWAVTLKSFSAAKARLAPVVPDHQRAGLAEATARRVVETCLAAGGKTTIVTPDGDIEVWAAEQDIEIISEPIGGGLNGAAMAAARVAAERNMTYAILHADLPLLQVADLDAVAGSRARAVIAPSRNGGTSLLAAADPIRFSYGADSFRRHLRASAPLGPHIIVTPGLALDLDTPQDLLGAASLERGAWLRQFLD